MLKQIGMGLAMAASLASLPPAGSVGKARALRVESLPYSGVVLHDSLEQCVVEAPADDPFLDTDRVVRLADGTVVSLHSGLGRSVAASRNGKAIDSVDLHARMMEWLKLDRIWTTHDQVNQMRYMYQKLGSFIPIVNSAVPAGGGLLAVIGWRDPGSHWMLKAEHLVRITVKDTIEIEPLRDLAGPEGLTLGLPLDLRLATCGSRNYLLTPVGRSGSDVAGVQYSWRPISDDGTETGPARTLPRGLMPIEEVAQSLVALKPGSANRPYLLLNLQTGFIHPLPGALSAKWVPTFVAGSAWVLYYGVDGINLRYSILNLATGHTRLFHCPAGVLRAKLWKGLVVAWQYPEQNLFLFDAETGRQVTRLTIPKEPAQHSKTGNGLAGLARNRGDRRDLMTLQVHAPSISCNGCAVSIKRSLGKLSGVHTIEVDLQTKIITIEYDAGTLTDNAIVDRLEAAGFPSKAA